MANLETLELTINGSATSASGGIDKLITSLSSLSDALAKPYSDLRDFNEELKKTGRIAKSINFSSLSKATSGVKASVAKTKAKQPYIPKGMNVDAVNKGSPDAVPQDVYDAQYKARKEAWQEELRLRREQNTANRERVRAEQEYKKLVANEIPKLQKKAMQDAISAEKKAMEARGEDTKVIMEQS